MQYSAVVSVVFCMVSVKWLMVRPKKKICELPVAICPEKTPASLKFLLDLQKYHHSFQYIFKKFSEKILLMSSLKYCSIFT